MLSLDDIRRAEALIRSRVIRTPLLPCAPLSKRCGVPVYLKCENLQHTGSFKVRGALNFVLRHSTDELQQGLIAASAGNHAQGLAYAGRHLGIRVRVVMPESTPLTKINACQALGAEIMLFGENFDDALVRAKELSETQGQLFVPAFDHPLIMAGQGTLGLEILEQLPAAASLIVPIGGGGLISGIAVAIKTLKPAVRLIGVQVEGADAARLSRQKGELVSLARVHSLADGIAIKRPGVLCFEIMQRYVDEIITVTEDEISRAMLALMESSRLLVEGAGAVSLAALLYRRELRCGASVCLLSGGNVDLQTLDRVIRRGLVAEGRYLKVQVELPDSPGALARLTALLERERANIYQISHDRRNERIALEQTLVQLELETRGFDHIRTLIERLEENGYCLNVSR